MINDKEFIADMCNDLANKMCVKFKLCVLVDSIRLNHTCKDWTDLVIDFKVKGL